MLDPGVVEPVTVTDKQGHEDGAGHGLEQHDRIDPGAHLTVGGRPVQSSRQRGPHPFLEPLQ